MYAHPLVLNAVPVGSSVASSITRNVLLTATMGNTLAAWDADTAAQVPFRKRTLCRMSRTVTLTYSDKRSKLFLGRCEAEI